jgi:hypothetical protein
VCYDAQDQRSYNQAKQILGTSPAHFLCSALTFIPAGIAHSCRDPSFITILVACKSDSLDHSLDPGPELPAERAAKLGSQYGAKFVQVTNRTAEGTSHMMQLLQWMIDHAATYLGESPVARALPSTITMIPSRVVIPRAPSYTSHPLFALPFPSSLSHRAFLTSVCSA